MNCGNMRHLTILTLLLSLPLACHKQSAAPEPSAAPKVNETPEAAHIVVTKDSKDLILTYVDATGAYHDVTKIEDVPETSRAQVLVRDLSKSPDELRSAEYLYIADLRTPDAKGRFPCGAVSRHGFDRHGAVEAAAQAAEGSAAEQGQLVTLYTASWCGVCKKAKAFLRQKGVPFVEKDVEKDAGAEKELEIKASAKGLRVQGVPVVDVAGELMMGFDQDALNQLLEKKGISKAL